MKRKYTLIWIDAWNSGSHRHTAIKKTFFEVDEVKQIMESDYGPRAQYLFEGHVCTIGETVEEDDIIRL